MKRRNRFSFYDPERKHYNRGCLLMGMVLILVLAIIAFMMPGSEIA